MNPDAWWMADVWYCVVCGQPTDEIDDKGDPIHKECEIQRDVMQAEAREER